MTPFGYVYNKISNIILMPIIKNEEIPKEKWGGIVCEYYVNLVLRRGHY
jgi:hypothetical protein